MIEESLIYIDKQIEKKREKIWFEFCKMIKNPRINTKKFCIKTPRSIPCIKTIMLFSKLVYVPDTFAILHRQIDNKQIEIYIDRQKYLYFRQIYKQNGIDS